jgi:L-alanine-DL-glutamate epimerase-like enolase superfamily enzyme
MLRTFQARREHWPLASPFRISRGVKTAADVIAVEIGHEGHVGNGEAVPYARYGETPDSVLDQVEAVAEAVRGGMTRIELMRALPPGAARNAIDCALWDLEAKLSGRTVAELLHQAEPAPVTIALTVSLDEPEAMARAARAMNGAPVIKVKVDADTPEACLRAVRAAAPDAQLIVDPNEGWSFELLRDIQPVLEELKVALVEQPLPADEDQRLTGFNPTIPICADESCHVAADLDELAGRYQVVNIKLDKTGGLTEALDLLAAARSRGFGVMIGCMVSSSRSIAPALLLAADAEFVDLDGPLWLKADHPGGVRLEGGKLAPAAPGFWGTPCPQAMTAPSV